MATIVAGHSFHRGTGQSTILANLAASLAASGRRVCLIDANFASPSLYLFFGLDSNDIGFSLNDYIWGLCTIEDTILDVGQALPGFPGAVYLVTASPDQEQISRAVRSNYYHDWLSDGIQELAELDTLDTVLLDIPVGLTDQTLSLIALADKLLVVLRPDHQDYLGTGIILDVARQLDVPEVDLLVNQVPDVYELEQVRAEIETAYENNVVTVLRYYDDVLLVGSGELFLMRHPDHPLSDAVRQMTALLV